MKDEDLLFHLSLFVAVTVGTFSTLKLLRTFEILCPINQDVFLQLDSAGVDADIQREYARQREHLERSVASLRKKLAKDSEIHRADNVRIMQVRHQIYFSLISSLR